MASTGTHKRSRSLAAAALCVLLSVLAHAQGARAAVNPGGTSPGSTPAGPTTGGARPTGKTPTTGGATPTATPRRVASHGRRAVRLLDARCAPSTNCSTNPHQVSVRGYLVLSGNGLEKGLRVAFPRVRNARIAKNSPMARIYQSPSGLAVHLPGSAHSGRIAVLIGGGRMSNAVGPITVLPYALHPPQPRPKAPVAPPVQAANGSAFEGQGMWIWYLSKSAGGNLPALVAQAHAAGVSTVFVKSSDGASNYWSQFSPELVATLHANGLKACGWQYVYGTNPVGEAELGAKAAAAGADCLVIDAESEYEGHYAAAQRYIETLRAKVGPAYPVGLATFPYVDYHESEPYSVFMGPNGAQFNAPQMYWKAIGTSVANVYAHTYEQNLIYGRPIAPLGQTYESPSSSDLIAFRSLAAAYGAHGLSWWDWQETSTSGWSALAAPLNTSLTVPNPELTSPLLSQGAKGDQVLWMQEHLASAIPAQATSGIFDSTTASYLEQFQTAHGITASGKTDPSTWAALLALPPVAVDWTGGGPAG
ncbi:MAG TPA: peptidoglycan-binding domain-containing protein [Solirubrobacteraceae bacterium]|nr:peptidoglycan-binding domain-containing protein [Solirubrobacteraceae bacterium]